MKKVKHKTQEEITKASTEEENVSVHS